MNNKPVAWWTGKYDDESEDFIFSETRQKFIDHPIAKNHLLFPIPLYTHPVKKLTETKYETVFDGKIQNKARRESRKRTNR